MPLPATLPSTDLAGVMRQFEFFAPLQNTLVLQRGSGDPTFTRASIATVMGYGPTANEADGQTLLTVASGEARFQGARRVSEGVWSKFFADGSPIPDSTLNGYLAEGARTQYLGVTDTPATQTTASLGTGSYTLWVNGSGSAIASAGTATISGEAAATDRSPNTFSVTGAGTVTVTVTGSLDRFQLENGAFASSYIPNAGAAGTSVTRAADVLTYPTSGNIADAAGTVYAEYVSNYAPGNSPRIIGDSAGTAPAALYTNGAGAIGAGIFDGTNNVQSTGSNAVAGAVGKGASSWAGSAVAVSFNGAAAVTGSYDGAFSYTALAIGTNVGGGAYLFGTIRKVRIAQVALPNYTLQRLTA